MGDLTAAEALEITRKIARDSKNQKHIRLQSMRLGNCGKMTYPSGTQLRF